MVTGVPAYVDGRMLDISAGNQRVLLHRGRSRLRQLFEDEFREVR